MHLHAKPLDLRQNALNRVTQPPQQGQQTMNPLNMTSLPPPFVNIQNSFNPERSRKRKATRPQHLFLPPNRVPPPGPLTPEDDDDVVIIEPKETFPKGKDPESSQGLMNEQYRRNFGVAAENISEMDTKTTKRISSKIWQI
ncbi:hypothetical protein FSP39_023447 [Pinctada imbricata]|uniref:Uncharacterized protein n=1 Tax=Pinctada imbricata TaxID=66713 RepID=A0AA88YI96_PINIB|nr:hypothetical protein FSP39_023447 [Pinctada imbricata]